MVRQNDKKWHAVIDRGDVSTESAYDITSIVAIRS